MKSRPIGTNQNILATHHNDRRDDARGGSFLLPHQQLGALALGTAPSNGQVIPIVINGTTITVTAVTGSPTNPNDVKAPGTAAGFAANLVNFLRRPDLTNSNQVAASSPNQLLLSSVGWAYPGATTTVVPFSLNKNVNGITGGLTSFNITGITVTSGSWTAQTMQLYIEDGAYYINGVRYLFTGGSTPTVTAPSSHPRIDLLTIDSSGTLAWTTGTEAASPVAPSYPSNKMPLCELYNVVGETVLCDNENQQAGAGYISNDVRPTTSSGVIFTSIASNLDPDVTDTRNIGESSGNEWQNIFAKNIYAATALQIGGVNVAASKFGGTGADGALTTSSGTTTIDCGNAAIVVKNYTSISVTGTANLAFINPHANGTIVVLKSQGNVTITSSTNPAIDLTSMGATAGSPGQGLITGPTAGGTFGITIVGGNSSPGIPFGGRGVYNASTVNGKGINVFAGAGGNGGGGAAGGDTNGAGGRGGGGLYIECGGALNITSTIKAAGGNGTGGSGTGSNGYRYGGAGGGSNTDSPSASITSGTSTGPAGGGGGGGGSICILYATLTANSATLTVTGGSAGTGGAVSGTAGANGWSLIAANTEFS